MGNNRNLAQYRAGNDQETEATRRAASKRQRNAIGSPDFIFSDIV